MILPGQKVTVVIWPEYQECLDCPNHRQAETIEGDLDFAICIKADEEKCPAEPVFDRYVESIRRGIVERN